MNAPSRRRLLTGTATLATLATASTPATASPARPDAALIAACTAMIAAQRAYNAIWDGTTGIMDDTLATEAAAPFVAQWHPLLDEMERLHATTAAGIAARAQALAVLGGGGEHSFDYPGTMTERMLSYLLRDAAALPAEVLA